jgi:Na+-translocating ferredoxin:NAD+ oxidoreductase subunit B
VAPQLGERKRNIMPDPNLKKPIVERVTRRQAIGDCLRGVGVLCIGGALGSLMTRAHATGTVWQIDPAKCTQCGKCATNCVLNPSAVKCVHEYALCGYCNQCFGYFRDQRVDDSETVENQRCPTDAIKRSFVEDPYYQYVIDEPKCIGCGICVKGCKAFGNSSLIMQVRHDRCINCNECSIAVNCPSEAYVRVPADDPYLLRTKKKKPG